MSFGATDLMQVGTAEASVLYPAATEEELQDLDQLVVSYRRAMGRERILWAVVGAALGAWLVNYVRFGPRARRR